MNDVDPPTSATPTADDTSTIEEQVVVVVWKAGVLNVGTVGGDWRRKSEDSDVVTEGTFTSKVVSFVL